MEGKNTEDKSRTQNEKKNWMNFIFNCANKIIFQLFDKVFLMLSVMMLTFVVVL